MIRRFVIASLSVVALTAAASAADMYVAPQGGGYKDAPAPLPATWTGCYIGGNGGGAWSHMSDVWVSELAGPAPGPLSPVEPRPSITSSGWAYGGQAGCDYQFNSNWVIGIRGMGDGSNATGSANVPLLNFGNFATGQTDTISLRSFETVTGRLGFVPSPAVMLYAVGGVAWAQDNFSSTQAGHGEIFTGSDTRTGYDVGGGLSWMVAPHWELWVEYDHMGFANKTIPVNGVGIFTGFSEGLAQTQNVDKVLVGFNWRFGNPIPSKY